MAITFFTDSTVKQIRQEVEAALKAIGDKHGLKVSTLGSIGYSSNTMHTSKLSFAIASKQPEITGVTTNLIGKRFKSGSRTFTVREIEGGKYLCSTNRGARYLITPESLSKMIAL